MPPNAECESLLEGVTLTRSSGVVRVTSDTPLRVLGSARVGDDLALTRNIVAMSIEKAREQSEPEEHLYGWAMQAGIQEPFVGLLTTASAEDIVPMDEATCKWKISALLFADLATLCTAGSTQPQEPKTEGSIDLVILTDASLTVGAMVSAIVTATEAKVRALVESRAATSDESVVTGTPADNVIVACLSKGERIREAGPTTQFGYLLGKAVHEGMTRALQTQGVRNAL